MKKSPMLLILIISACCFFACQRDHEFKTKLLGQIKSISDLSLLEVKFKKFLIFTQKTKILFINLKTSTQVMCIYPRVELGVDLDQIQANDIDINDDTNTIRVLLPAVSVKIFEYDEKDYSEVIPELTSSKKGNRIKMKTIELMHRYAENEVRKAISSLDYKNLCESRIINNLKILFSNLGYSSDIQFRPTKNKYLMAFNPALKLEKITE